MCAVTYSPKKYTRLVASVFYAPPYMVGTGFSKLATYLPSANAGGICAEMGAQILSPQSWLHFEGSFTHIWCNIVSFWRFTGWIGKYQSLNHFMTSHGSPYSASMSNSHMMTGLSRTKCLRRSVRHHHYAPPSVGGGQVIKTSFGRYACAKILLLRQCF